MDDKDMIEMSACEMARRGKTMTEIMKQTGLGENTVRNILKKAKLKTHYKPTKITLEISDEVMRLHCLNMSCREIAIEIGIGVSTVSSIIRRMQTGDVKKPAASEIEKDISAMHMLELALEMALQAIRKMKEG